MKAGQLRSHASLFSPRENYLGVLPGGDLFTVGKTIGPFFRAQNHANPESPPRWHPIGSKRMIRSTKGYTEEIRLRERSLSALKKTIHAKDGLEAQGLILRIDPIPLATPKFIQI